MKRRRLRFWGIKHRDKIMSEENTEQAVEHKPKPNKWLFAFVCVAIFGGLFAVQKGCNEALRYKSPPPGYEIVQDQFGHYGARRVGEYESYVLGGDDHFTTKQQAIDDAWEYYDYKLRQVRRDAREPLPDKPASVWKKVD